MSKAKELRDLSEIELEANCNDARRKLFELKNEGRQLKKVEKPHLIKATKTEIARMLTVIREKQMAKQNRSP